MFVPPYGKKQFQCLIFYDINLQLCSAVAASKLTISEDLFAKVEEKQDVNAVCTLAKDWVFTNISIFAKYKESAEKLFKLPATCGEVCGVEETMTEANYYCKYYNAGLQILKSQLSSTTANNVNNNAAVAPVVPEPDFSARADIPVSANSDPVRPQDTNTKIMNGQIKQTELSVAKTTQKIEDAVDDAAVKSETAAQATSKQTPSVDEANNSDDTDVNVNRVENPVAPAPDSVIPQVNKTSVVQAEKPAIVNEALPDLPVQADGEQKPPAVLENPKPKPIADGEEYGGK